MNISAKQRWTICWIYAAGILALSVMPADVLTGTPELFPHQDKVLHGLLYGGWALLLSWALQRPARKRPAFRMVIVVLIAASYGALMEILQAGLPRIGRSFEWLDMLANLAGAILAVSLFHGVILTRTNARNPGNSPQRTQRSHRKQDFLPLCSKRSLW